MCRWIVRVVWWLAKITEGKVIWREGGKEKQVRGRRVKESERGNRG